MLDGVGCDWLVNELGPPPDAILRIPPPPMPSFIDFDGWMKELAGAEGVHREPDNETFPCHWCHLARRLGDAPAKSAAGPASDAGNIYYCPPAEAAGALVKRCVISKRFFSACARKSRNGHGGDVVLCHLGIVAHAFTRRPSFGPRLLDAQQVGKTFRFSLSGQLIKEVAFSLNSNRKTMKGTWDFGSFFSESGSILMGGCSSPSGNGNEMLAKQAAASSDQADNGHQSAAPQQASAPSHPPTRALWAGVKTMSEGNHYTITHAQPFEQRVQRSVGRLAPDEDSAGYTTLQPTRLDYTTDNQIYYCCTDLMMMSPHRYAPRRTNSYKVTSLDDSLDNIPAANSLYVNMSPVHPFRMQQQITTPCNSTCCPLRSSCHSLPLNTLAIGRSAVSPAVHLHPINTISLGENWRKV